MPNGAYIHLLINHVPVILAPIGTVAVLLAWLTGRRAIWLYALATLTFAGISAYPVMATGHSAEHTVRELVHDASRSALHNHEEAGESTMWALLAVGAVAAYAWWRLATQPIPSGITQSKSMMDAAIPLWLRLLVLVLAAFATAGVTYTSEQGGYIIHHEAHPGTPVDTLRPRPQGPSSPGSGAPIPAAPESE